MKNYGELKDAIAGWVDRRDSKFLLELPGFIRLAESEIYRDLKSHDNEFVMKLTAADNPKNPITLPQNFKSFKLVLADGFPLERLSDSEYQRDVAARQAGNAYGFATLNRKLYLMPHTSEDIDPADDVSIEVHYYGTESITEMAPFDTAQNPNSVPESDGTPSTTTERGDEATTRVFLINPDLYLAGALYWAYLWLQVPDKAQLWKAKFEEANTDLKVEARRAARSGSTNTVQSAYYDGSYHR
ncbi:MAG: phage adaptor protein, partial [Alcanivorax sp.]